MSPREERQFNTLNELVVAAEASDQKTPQSGESAGWLPETPDSAVFGNQTGQQDDTTADDRLPVSAPEHMAPHALAERVGLGDWSPYDNATEGAGYQPCACLLNRAGQKESTYPFGSSRLTTILINLTGF